LLILSPRTFCSPKIGDLGCQTETLGLAHPIKSQKFDRKIDFLKIFWKIKTILGLEMTRKKLNKIGQLSATNTLDTNFLTFEIPYFK
jgi:hypothetical protein